MAAYVFAGIAALVHVLFFVMESVLWTKPTVRARFGMSQQDAVTTRLLAFNQGFYNLFLSAGIVFGFILVASGSLPAGRAVLGFVCASMLAAALVLAVSSPRMMRGAILQGTPPFVALILLGMVAFA